MCGEYENIEGGNRTKDHMHHVYQEGISKNEPKYGIHFDNEANISANDGWYTINNSIKENILLVEEIRKNFFQNTKKAIDNKNDLNHVDEKSFRYGWKIIKKENTESWRMWN